MDLFTPVMVAPLAVLGVVAGCAYGEVLHASGVKLERAFSLRRAYLLDGVIFGALMGNLLLALSREWRWRMPVHVEYYSNSFCASVNIAALIFVIAALATIGYRESRRKGLAIVAIGCVVLAGSAGVFAASSHLFGGKPVTLLPFRSTSDGVVLQTCGSTCAAASGANVARYFGIMVTEADMVKAMKTLDTGTSDAGVVYGLAEYQLKAVRRFYSKRDISTVRVPALLMVDLPSAPNGHCVAFMGMREDKAEIWDPASGRQLLTLDEVRVRWRGWAFEVTR